MTQNPAEGRVKTSSRTATAAAKSTVASARAATARADDRTHRVRSRARAGDGGGGGRQDLGGADAAISVAVAPKAFEQAWSVCALRWNAAEHAGRRQYARRRRLPATADDAPTRQLSGKRAIGRAPPRAC